MSVVFQYPCGNVTAGRPAPSFFTSLESKHELLSYIKSNAETKKHNILLCR